MTEKHVKTVRIENISVSVYSSGRLEIQLAGPVNSEQLISWRDRNSDELAELKAPYIDKNTSIRVFKKTKPKWNPGYKNRKGKPRFIK